VVNSGSVVPRTSTDWSTALPLQQKSRDNHADIRFGGTHSSVFLKMAAPVPPDEAGLTFSAAGCVCRVEQVVVSLQTQPPPKAVLAKTLLWVEALAKLYGIVATPGVQVTVYGSIAHPSRSLLLGSRLTALIYPTGLIVAQGVGHPEEVVVQALRRAESVCTHVVGLPSVGASSPPVANAVVVSALVPEISDLLGRDPLAFDRLACRNPKTVLYEPELTPALVITFASSQWHPECTVIATEAGTVTIGGCRSRAQASAALAEFKSFLLGLPV
jgi:TATA-box binding protein (TBP) (component of TFIID and TFIIIB)